MMSWQGDGFDLIDRAQLEALRAEIGEEDMAEVIQIFLAESDEILSRCRKHPAATDWVMELHALKGCALNLGLSRMAEMCHRAEMRQRGTADGEAEFQQIAACYAASTDALLSFLSGGPA